mgnify:CR=1 FL=1
MTAHVGTRISAQVRSHAQKVLSDYSGGNKRSKSKDNDESGEDLQIGDSAEIACVSEVEDDVEEGEGAGDAPCSLDNLATRNLLATRHPDTHSELVSKAALTPRFKV